MRLYDHPVLRVDLDHNGVRALRSRVTATSAEPANLGPVVPAGTYPHPGECVPNLFIYGTLKPGHGRWPLLAPYLVGEPVPATMSGELRDTGHGWPALKESDAGQVSGLQVRGQVDRMAALLATLDEAEGVERGLFTRQARTAGGRVAWVYVAGTCANLGRRLDSWSQDASAVNSS